MSTRAAIIEKTETGYRGIYCHHDGYFEGVGRTLIDFYSDDDKVKALIDLGDISSLGEINDSALAYTRNLGEDYEDNKPLEGKSLDEVKNKIGHDGHVYIWNGKWNYQTQ